MGKWARIIWMAVAVIFNTAPAGARDSWDHPPRKLPPGIEHRTFQSPSMRTRVGYNVALPPGYEHDAQRRYPVIYYLHGFEGDESSYLEYAKYWREALPRTGPCILVFANGGGTSMFCDSADGSVRGETVFVKELMPEIDRQFRTLAEPRGRALHGYSMGGFGALKFVFKYPNLFGSAVAYGATLSTAEEMQKRAGKLYRAVFASRERFEANDPLAILETNAAELRDRINVQMLIGTKDDFVPGNKRLSQRMDALRVAHSYIEIPEIKHNKDDLYEKAAAHAFAFTAEMLGRRKPMK